MKYIDFKVVFLVSMGIITGAIFGFLYRDAMFKDKTPPPGCEITLKVPKDRDELRKQILINHAQASILSDLDKWWSEKPRR